MPPVIGAKHGNHARSQQQTTQGPAPRHFQFRGQARQRSIFPGALRQRAVPERVTLTGEFAPPKAKETPEERKARLAGITPAEKLARNGRAIARMRAKLAKGHVVSAPPAPAGPVPTAPGPSPQAEGAKGKRRCALRGRTRRPSPVEAALPPRSLPTINATVEKGLGKPGP